MTIVRNSGSSCLSIHDCHLQFKRTIMVFTSYHTVMLAINVSSEHVRKRRFQITNFRLWRLLYEALMLNHAVLIVEFLWLRLFWLTWMLLFDKNDYISTSEFGELIYNHYVFDLPKMLDLCALFYAIAPQQLINILSNVFSFQEKYFVDLESMLHVLFDICDRIERELAVSFSGADRFSDLTAYLADISWSLYTFLIALSKLTTPRAIRVCFNSGLLER
ncbi:hypothetical protein AHF37_12208 [Paragonimus kellicotti]|nr:hypothetical protein AHF37_12208 [Paragonimus kellicotti]